jgi:hypothetical protein
MRFVFYINEDNIDINKLASKMKGRISVGCMRVKNAIIYKSGRIDIIGESDLEAVNGITEIIAQLSTINRGKQLKIISIGKVDGKNIARAFCPGVLAMLDVIRKESLDILDSLEFPEPKRGKIAQLIAEEIMSDTAFSNFVLSSEQFGGHHEISKTGPPRIFNGWLLIDDNLKGRLLDVYQRKIRDNEITTTAQTDMLERFRKVLKTNEKEILIGIAAGLLVEAIIRLVVAALGVARKMGREKIDSYPIGKVLKEKRKVRSKELSDLLEIPEPLVLLELNSLVKGGAARIKDRGTRMYELRSEKVEVAMGWAKLNEEDFLVCSESFKNQFSSNSVQNISSKYTLTFPRVQEIISVLEKSRLLC